MTHDNVACAGQGGMEGVGSARSRRGRWGVALAGALVVGVGALAWPHGRAVIQAEGVAANEARIQPVDHEAAALLLAASHMTTITADDDDMMLAMLDLQGEQRDGAAHQGQGRESRQPAAREPETRGSTDAAALDDGRHTPQAASTAFAANPAPSAPGSSAGSTQDPLAACEECLSNRPFRYVPQTWNAELVDRCVEVATDIDAELGAQLARKRGRTSAERDAFVQALRQSPAGGRLLAMSQLKQRDPELYRTKISELSGAMQVKRVAAQLREAISTGSEPQIESLTERLRNLLQLQLVLSLKARGEYICKLEDRLRIARQQLEHDAAHFKETVESQLQLLTGQPASTPR